MISYDTDWNPHADLQAQDRYVAVSREDLADRIELIELVRRRKSGYCD